MTETIFAAAPLESTTVPSGASQIGVSPISGLTDIPGMLADDGQGVFAVIATLLAARIAGVQDNGIDITFRNKVNFTGNGVVLTDDPESGRTNVNIAGAGDYPHVSSVIEDGLSRGQHTVLNVVSDWATVTEDGVNDWWNLNIPTPAPFPDHIETVQDDGTPLDPHLNLNVTGGYATITEDDVNDAYVLDIPIPVEPPDSVQTIQDDGVDVPYHPNLNVTGGWATLTEDVPGDATVLDIPAPPEPTPPPELSSATFPGIVILTEDPVDPLAPLAVADNDLRMADARPAADGSVTLPSAGTNVLFAFKCTSLTRPASAEEGQLIYETDTDAYRKNVSEDPLSPAWTAIGNLEDIPIADDGEANPNEVTRSDDSRLDNPRPPELESVTLETAAPEISLPFICSSTTRPDLPKHGQLIYELDTDVVMKQMGTPAVPDWQPVGTGAATVTFQEEGTTIGVRNTVNFTGEGATVFDDPTNSATIVDIHGVRAQEDGVDVAIHAKINFVGMDVQDDAANDRVNIVATGGVPDATTSLKGKVLMSAVPADAANPTAVGTNDPRIPTQGENDALVGTSGTPSTTNKYVTDADARVPTTGENNALAGTNGTPSDTNRFVTDSDPRNANTRVPTDGSVTDAKVAAGAAIAESKLALATDAGTGVGSRRTLGTGALQAAPGNDSRIPTQGENDALAGTSGTPSDTNRFVTDADARVPLSGENDALQGTSGTPSNTNRYVTDADARNTNTRTPSDGSVTDIKVASGAAIAESKLALASDAAAGTASRRTLGTGSLQAASGADTRIPTQGENDALVGTYGTPGSSNRFATETDPKFADYISGLTMQWNTPGNNGNLITISSGAAWIESLGKVYNVPSTITGPTQTFSPSAWHYVYLYDNSGTPAIEISTVAPGTPYKGTARSRSTDTSRRFIAPFLTDATATPVARAFTVRGGGTEFIYTNMTAGSPYRVLNGMGIGASNVNLSFVSICPPLVTESVLIMGQMGGVAGNGLLEFGHGTATTRIGMIYGVTTAGAQFPTLTTWLPMVPTTPSIYYTTSGIAGMAFYVDVSGYKFAR